MVCCGSRQQRNNHECRGKKDKRTNYITQSIPEHCCKEDAARRALDRKTGRIEIVNCAFMETDGHSCMVREKDRKHNNLIQNANERFWDNRKKDAILSYMNRAIMTD